MTGKGIQAQRRDNQRQRDIRAGKIKPIEYTMSVAEALRKAGLSL